MSLSDEHNRENTRLLCCLGVQTAGSFILAQLQRAVFSGPQVTLIMRCVINLITASQMKEKDTVKALIKVTNKIPAMVRCILIVDSFSENLRTEEKYILITSRSMQPPWSGALGNGGRVYGHQSRGRVVLQGFEVVRGYSWKYRFTKGETFFLLPLLPFPDSFSKCLK